MKIQNYLKSIIHNQQGSVFIMVAAAAFMLITATGVAVDMSRAQTLQTKLSSALDAAGLAAGATTSSVPPTINPATNQTWTQADWVQSQAQKYFNANFPNNYMGAGTVTVNTSLSRDKTTISLTATTVQATTFLNAVGITSVNVGANSQITRQNSGMELALALDNTGSMGSAVNPNDSSVTKINALKCALGGNAAFNGNSTFCTSNNQVTTGLLDILYGNNTTLPDLFVGLVPFSDVVRIATANDSIIHGASTGGCVTSRSNVTHSAVDPAVSVTYTNGSTSNAYITLDESEDAPASSAYYFSARSSSDCPVANLLPLTQSKTTVLSDIKTMTANGNTMTNLGLAWGWRVLSPYWNGYWGTLPTFTDNAGASHTLPLPYNTPHMTKVLILMTDGMNTSGSNSAYGSTAPSITTLDNETLAICTALKNNGVIIYTIGFGQNGNNNPNDQYSVNGPMLQKCASDPAYYFLAPTNAQLQSAFEQIGDALANLRVSQ